MSLRTPNEVYFKSRRIAVIFSGLLLLVVGVGVDWSATDESVAVFSFTLKSPEYLAEILAVMTAYAFWQFWVAWEVQSDEVRQFGRNRADVLLTFAILIFSILFYVSPHLDALSSRRFFEVEAGIWITLIGSFVGAYATYRQNAYARGRRIRAELKVDSKLQEILTAGSWILKFNPKMAAGGSKKIEFVNDGSVGDGRNQNEHTWRVREGYLEILNQSGLIFSRFAYDESADRWRHTNDVDTLSLRSQEIFRSRPIAGEPQAGRE